MLQSFADPRFLVCAVAGTRPLVVGPTIFGTLPGKRGVISLFTSTEQVYELAQQEPGIHYYWSRQPTKRCKTTPYYTMPTTSAKPRPTAEEPWHGWTNEQIADRIIAMCEELAYTRETIDEVSVRHGLSHFGFERLFQQRWPLEYYAWKKNKTIPTRDNMSQTFAERFSFVSQSG
jgi:hypothetical protein